MTGLQSLVEQSTYIYKYIHYLLVYIFRIGYLDKGALEYGDNNILHQ